MKYVKRVMLILIACVLGIWVWKMIFTTNVSYDNLTRITHIKEMIRLNTFEMVNEFVYKDTLDDIGVVYNIKSRITIGFDLDSLKYRETDGVLEVELPPANVIDIHSLDCRLSTIQEQARNRRQIQCGSTAECLDMTVIRA